jgi:hypothetical protein
MFGSVEISIVIHILIKLFTFCLNKQNWFLFSDHAKLSPTKEFSRTTASSLVSYPNPGAGC